MFHFDNYAITINFLDRKHTFTWIKNGFVIIEITRWITIKENLNNLVFILANNYYVNTCDFMEKGVSRTWKVGTVKELVKSGMLVKNELHQMKNEASSCKTF